MVCAKCQKLLTKTTLATPAVKRKNDQYLGSSTSSIASRGAASSSSAKAGPTLGNTGIIKSKLLSKSAMNPYAAYSASCDGCKTKVDAGKKYCQRCAYKQNACSMCGKALTAPAGAESSKGKNAVPTVNGQKFSAK
ncbi:hypothetical protein LTR66_000175 [Elasticomyces elasticus]|nr:hypothetical protein LTR66_000175 [Elasticomyces elasticus]